MILLENTSDNVINNLTFNFNEFKYKFNLNDSNKFNDDVNIITTKTDNLKPGEKILMLLSIYESDKNYYPKNYISSVLEMNYIEYEINNKKIKENIRLPNKEKANKIFLPFGWEGQ